MRDFDALFDELNSLEFGQTSIAYKRQIDFSPTRYTSLQSVSHKPLKSWGVPTS